MKTILPQQSKNHEAAIFAVRDAILEAAKDKIAKIILFGSFARGDWVHDMYSKDGITLEYASDYDFLIVTRSSKQGSGYQATRFESSLDKKLKRFFTPNKPHSPTLVIESIERVNRELEKGQYFFTDIKNEGVLLYDSGEFELKGAKELSEEERKNIAKDDFEQWFSRGNDFLKNSKFNLGENMLTNGVFQLHQAAESFLNCALLVLTGYKPKTHDIQKLLSLCASQSNEFLKIFPIGTEEQKECFKLLRAAYIDARYEKDFSITDQQLSYLIERVEHLLNVVNDLCKAKVA